MVRGPLRAAVLLSILLSAVVCSSGCGLLLSTEGSEVEPRAHDAGGGDGGRPADAGIASDAATGSDDGGDDGGIAPACVAFEDGFDGDKPAFWAEWSSGMTTLARTGSELVITLAVNAELPDYAGYVATPVDLREAAVFVEVSELTGTASIRPEMFLFVGDGIMQVSLGFAGGRMIYRAWDEAQMMMRDDQIDRCEPCDMWWSIAFEGSDVVFRTSADGSTWVERRRMTSPVDPSAADVAIFAGTFDSDASPGVARYARLWSSPGVTICTP